jgi:hypothetical protein
MAAWMCVKKYSSSNRKHSRIQKMDEGFSGIGRMMMEDAQ